MESSQWTASPDIEAIKKSIKRRVYIIRSIIILSLILIGVALFTIRVSGEEETNVPDESMVVITEQHIWHDTHTTATVRKSELQSCMGYTTEEECCKWFNLCL